jgi:RNA polymerase sigma-70 factor (ECF subfamily)
MSSVGTPDTDALVDKAAHGDVSARQKLLVRHRSKLVQMIAVRMDRRLAARVDPSDVVQDALAEAARCLDDYLKQRPMPFYPWLRRLAWQRLVDLNRHHIRARRRSVALEVEGGLPLPDESAVALAMQLVSSGSHPSRRLIRAELRERVRAALARLKPRDREILVLRHLEQLSAREAAEVLGITERAAKARHVRALVRVRALFDEIELEAPDENLH